MLIVDSQIHLWRDAKMSASHRQIPTYSAEDALAEMKTGGVDCAVLHPPTNLGEPSNELALEAVRRHPDRFCVLGHFDLTSPDREAIVARWRERPGMLGFRFTLTQAHDRHWWTDGSLDWFWKAAEKAGQVVGLRAFGPLVKVFGQIAERHPGLRMHIDHIGRGGGRTEAKDAAAYADLDDMLALARLPNVGIKLSAAPLSSTESYPYRNIHDHIHRVVDAFGPARCFWGSDISQMPCSYRQCVTMFTEEMPWLKGPDLEQVMGLAFVSWLGWKRKI
jgi:predicted TIM-barrel fold metal-dependent hydrolase